MRVIDAKQFTVRRERLARKRRRTRRSLVLLSLAVLVAGYSYISFQRPLPQAVPVYSKTLTAKAAKPNLSWPAWGQAAVGQANYGVLDTSGDQVAKPTASVAKVMTALAVLRQKPLKAGEQGPILTFDDTDVGYFNYYASNDGSHVPVEIGEQLTEYQALQALMLPSANNIADSLARWAFGSLDAYVQFANGLAASLGMTGSHFTGASGFAADTVSTAHDLVLLGLAAIKEPAIVDIAAQTEATIPVAGQIRNTNRMLGINEITGLKTGNTNEAGGCYLFTAQHKYDSGQKVTIVGAVMAAPDLGAAMQAAPPLLASTFAGFGSIKIASRNQELVRYAFPWGASSTALVDSDVMVFGWRGSEIDAYVSADPVEADDSSSHQVGVVRADGKFDQQQAQIALSKPIGRPSLWWRLTRH